MTIEELQNKTDEQLSVICAEIFGYKVHSWGVTHPNGVDQGRGMNPALDLIPNYPADLNAMHEAEKTLNADEFKAYQRAFLDLTGVEGFGIFDNTDQSLITLPARERCIAFIAVKQTDGKEGV